MNIFQIPLSRKFFADSRWSLFGTLASVLTGLVAVKVITSLIGTNEYGQASLVLGVLALLNNLLIGPLMTAHLRVYFDYLARGLGSWFTKVFNRILAFAGLTAFMLYVLAAFLYDMAGNSIYWHLLVPSLVLLVAQPYFNALTNYLESHRRQKQLAAVNILTKAAYLAFLLALLTSPLTQASAVIVSQGLAIVLALACFRVPKTENESFHSPEDITKELAALRNSIAGLGWSLPLGSFVMWFLTTGDRYLIEYFSSPKEVGIYAINYGFWSLPYVLLNGWLEVLTRPLLYDKAAKNEWEGVKRILLWRTGFGLLISIPGTLIFYLQGESIAGMMLGKEYWAGWQLMVYISAAHCLYVVGYSVLPLFLASKKPQVILLATAIGAASNFAINLVLIPRYGIVGAAFSTFCSYIIWAAVLGIGAHLLMRSLLCPSIVVEKFVSAR